MSLSIQHAPLNSQNSLSPILNGFKGLTVAGLSYIPIQTIRIIGVALSIFGSYGKSLSIKIDYLANKLYSILVSHSLQDVTHAIFELKVLCNTKNRASRGVIWHEEDLQKSREFLQQMIDPHSSLTKGFPELSTEHVTSLKNYQPQGAINSGICFGASVYLIKSLLSQKITSEEELIQCLSPYKEGFPAEAAALQNLLKASVKTFKPETQLSAEEESAIAIDTIKMNEEITCQELNLRAKKASLSEEEYTKLFLQMQKEKEQLIQHRAKDLAKRINKMRVYRHREKQFARIASLIDLKLKHNLERHDKSLFYGILQQQEVREKFNQHKNGYYQLAFTTREQRGHSVVYIKQDFGSYLLDPNFGLIKCNPNNPADKLCKLIEKEYKAETSEDEQEPFLEVYHYY